MPKGKQLYSVHGKTKGKHIFEQAPVAHVWADNDQQAEEQGRHIISTNPLYNAHFNDEVMAKPEDE